MRVIGSGFGRTGTTSLKLALEQLGVGRCYHMQEVFLRPSHMRAWGAWRPGRPLDVDRLFAGFGAAVDFPVSLVYEQLVERYPEALVVHTVRDPDRWYDSTAATIRRAHDVLRSAPVGWLPPVRALYGMLDDVLWGGLFGGRFDDRDHALAVYERWTEQVVATVPPERLLVFDVADGWEPLCAALGLPVPDLPFPRVNDARTFQRRLTAIRWGPRAVLGATALTAGAALRHVRSGQGGSGSPVNRRRGRARLS